MAVHITCYIAPVLLTRYLPVGVRPVVRMVFVNADIQSVSLL